MGPSIKHRAYFHSTQHPKKPGFTTQSALELGPSHCQNGRLGQDLGFGQWCSCEISSGHTPRASAIARGYMGVWGCFCISEACLGLFLKNILS